MVLVPRKHFGQHFLHHPAIILRIIATLAPKTDEHLVEIGPGRGALTYPLLKQIHRLEAIELDRDLAALLQEHSKSYGELTLFTEDALKFDYSKIKLDDRLLRVFGNLPYNISTPLIFHLLTYHESIADMLFMLQKEVALRLTAQAGEHHYGRLSVMAQYHCDIELLFNVPASAFYPPPQVESSIVRLVPFHGYPYLANNYFLFENIVRHAFGQRRKTLRNSLKKLIDDSMWAHIQTPSNLRAEDLSVRDFVEISNAISL